MKYYGTVEFQENCWSKRTLPWTLNSTGQVLNWQANPGWLVATSMRMEANIARLRRDGKNKCSTVAEMGDRLATIDMAWKVGGCYALCPFRWGSWSQCNTMLHGPRPTSIPSGIMINPLTVWPQYTNVTDKIDRRMVM